MSENIDNQREKTSINRPLLTHAQRYFSSFVVDYCRHSSISRFVQKHEEYNVNNPLQLQTYKPTKEKFQKMKQSLTYKLKQSLQKNESEILNSRTLENSGSVGSKVEIRLFFLRRNVKSRKEKSQKCYPKPNMHLSNYELVIYPPFRVIFNCWTENELSQDT